MPHEITTISHESPFGFTVQNHLYHQGADRLVIILPGRGYTVEHPVLFHLRYLALENGCDVLPVQYGYQAVGQDLRPEEWSYLPQDVHLATEPVLARGYRHIYIAGKSIGTPLAIELAKSMMVSSGDVSLILLTPIGAAIQAMSDLTHVRTLAIIGTNDTLYSPQMVMQTRPNVQWKVFEGLDHGLFIEDNWRVSLDALNSIMGACEQFLRS
jgi:hypothetical protein